MQRKEQAGRVQTKIHLHQLNLINLLTKPTSHLFNGEVGLVFDSYLQSQQTLTTHQSQLLDYYREFPKVGIIDSKEEGVGKMKVSQEFIKQLEELYQTYEKEVKETKLANNTVNTHLYHSGNFVKWCRGEYVPGSRIGKKS